MKNTASFAVLFFILSIAETALVRAFGQAENEYTMLYPLEPEPPFMLGTDASIAPAVIAAREARALKTEPEVKGW